MWAWWIASGVGWAGTWQVVEERHIEAPPEVVWQVLVDFDAYGDWNPWLVQAHGEAVVGAGVDAMVQLRTLRKARHEVIEVVPHTRFCWQDVGWFVALARGHRCRELTPVAGGTHLRSMLQVDGSATGMVVKRFGDAMAAGLAAEATAWKARAEALTAEPPPDEDPPGP